MSSASNKATGPALVHAPDGTMGGPPGGEPSGPTTAAKLKQINTSLSDSGDHILVHFVSTQDQVVTVQLEISFATKFHQNLGKLLEQLKTMETPQPLWH